VDWSQLDLERVQWQAFENTVMNLRITKSKEVLSAVRLSTFQGLHGVTYFVEFISVVALLRYLNVEVLENSFTGWQHYKVNRKKERKTDRKEQYCQTYNVSRH